MRSFTGRPCSSGTSIVAAEVALEHPLHGVLLAEDGDGAVVGRFGRAAATGSPALRGVRASVPAKRNPPRSISDFGTPRIRGRPG